MVHHSAELDMGEGDDHTGLDDASLYSAHAGRHLKVLDHSAEDSRSWSRFIGRRIRKQADIKWQKITLLLNPRTFPKVEYLFQKNIVEKNRISSLRNA